jgi:hypothetical protein
MCIKKKDVVLYPNLLKQSYIQNKQLNPKWTSILIQGTLYPSITEAALETGDSKGKITQGLNSPNSNTLG